MRKRTIGLLLALLLAFSMTGCGSSSEPEQQQEEGQAAEQEEKAVGNDEDDEDESNYSDMIGMEFENDDIYIRFDETSYDFGFYGYEWESEPCQVIADESSVPLYCDEGFVVGYIKQGANVDITEYGIIDGRPSAFYRFPNPIEEAAFDYFYVNMHDCNLGDTVAQPESTEQAEIEVPEAPMSEEDAELDRMHEEAMALIDTTKTYTYEEFYNLMGEIADVLGVEFSADVAQDQFSGREKMTINLKGENLKETLDELTWFMLMGNSGNTKIDIYFGTETEVDTTAEEVEIILFTRVHREQ